MTTVTFAKGETRHYAVVTDAHGAQLRIDIAGECRVIDGDPVVLEDGRAGFAFTLGDNIADLPERHHSMRVWTRTGSDWLRRETKLSLNIEAGCA